MVKDSFSLEQRLAELWAVAARAWPTISLSAEVFSAFLVERAGSSEAALPGIDAAELYIVCACGRGDPIALAAFEKAYFDVVSHALQRMKLGAEVVDEVRQILWQRFFVADGAAPPKIHEYAGRGELRGLLRVAAVRVAIDLIRKQDKESSVADDELLQLPDGGDDPELQYVKEKHRAEFKVSFQEAVSALPVRDRNLIRMHLLDGLTVDQISGLHGVHRATATRWLTAARQFLLAETMRRIRSRIEIEPEEMKRLVSLIESRLDLSLSRILR